MLGLSILPHLFDNETRIYRVTDLEVVGQDLYLFIAGAIFGSLFITFRLIKFMNTIYILPVLKRNKELDYVRVVEEESGREFCYINPQGYRQTSEILASFMWWKYMKKSPKTHSLSVNRKATNIFYASVVLGIVIVITALYFIFTIQRGT